MEIYDWQSEEDIGEAAGIVVRGRLLDMLVTETTAGFETDVVDGVKIVWRGLLPTMEEAKAEAMVQARRAHLRAV